MDGSGWVGSRRLLPSPSKQGQSRAGLGSSTIKDQDQERACDLHDPGESQISLVARNATLSASSVQDSWHQDRHQDRHASTITPRLQISMSTPHLIYGSPVHKVVER